MISSPLLPPRVAAKIRLEPCDVPGLSPTCWIWTGGRFKKRGDYGAVGYQGKTWRAHRLTYTLLVGEIPAGLELDHLCRVHPCCNPAHLEAVTHTVNLSRGTFGHRINGECRYGHRLVGNAVIYRQRGPHEVWECRTCANDSRRARRAAARELVAA